MSSEEENIQAILFRAAKCGTCHMSMPKGSKDRTWWRPRNYRDLRNSDAAPIETHYEITHKACAAPKTVVVTKLLGICDACHSPMFVDDSVCPVKNVPTENEGVHREGLVHKGCRNHDFAEEHREQQLAKKKAEVERAAAAQKHRHPHHHDPVAAKKVANTEKEEDVEGESDDPIHAILFRALNCRTCTKLIPKGSKDRTWWRPANYRDLRNEDSAPIEAHYEITHKACAAPKTVVVTKLLGICDACHSPMFVDDSVCPVRDIPTEKEGVHREGLVHKHCRHHDFEEEHREKQLAKKKKAEAEAVAEKATTRNEDEEEEEEEEDPTHAILFRAIDCRTCKKRIPKGSKDRMWWRPSNYRQLRQLLGEDDGDKSPIESHYAITHATCAAPKDGRFSQAHGLCAACHNPVFIDDTVCPVVIRMDDEERRVSVHKHCRDHDFVAERRKKLERKAARATATATKKKKHTNDVLFREVKCKSCGKLLPNGSKDRTWWRDDGYRHLEGDPEANYAVTHKACPGPSGCTKFLGSCDACHRPMFVDDSICPRMVAKEDEMVHLVTHKHCRMVDEAKLCRREVMPLDNDNNDNADEEEGEAQ